MFGGRARRPSAGVAGPRPGTITNRRTVRRGGLWLFRVAAAAARSAGTTAG